MSYLPEDKQESAQSCELSSTLRVETYAYSYLFDWDAILVSATSSRGNGNAVESPDTVRRRCSNPYRYAVAILSIFRRRDLGVLDVVRLLTRRAYKQEYL